MITTYSATLINNFGYSRPRAALLNTPSGAVSIASTLIVGYGVQYTSQRWAWIVACCIPGILGGGLMSFATNSKGAQLAGIYLVNAITATLIVIYQWTASNVAGQTKRVIAVSLISGSFSVGNIVGPQTFQARDAPAYTPAKITVLATQASGALVAFVLFLYYAWANKRKTISAQGMVGSQSEEEMWQTGRICRTRLLDMCISGGAGKSLSFIFVHQDVFRALFPRRFGLESEDLPPQTADENIYFFFSILPQILL